MKRGITRIFLAIIFLSWPLFAAIDQCPHIEDIKKIPISAEDMIEIERPHLGIDINGFPRLDPGRWQTKPFVSFFGTSEKWHWSINSITAFSKDEALEKARKQLSALEVTTGPFLAQLFYQYCIYSDKKSLESSMASTRPMWQS